MLDAAGGYDGPGEGNLGVAVVQVPRLATSMSECPGRQKRRERLDLREVCCDVRTWHDKSSERAGLTACARRFPTWILVEGCTPPISCGVALQPG